MGANENMDFMRKTILDNGMTEIPSDIVLNLIDSISILSETLRLKDDRIEMLNQLVTLHKEKVRMLEKTIDAYGKSL